MKNKKILIIGAAVVCLIAAILTLKPGTEKRGDATEKIDRYLGITKNVLEEVFIDEQYFKEKFNNDIADKNTIDLFKFLQFTFQNDNLDSHFSDVLNYLINLYGEEKGRELLELYKVFTVYEIKIHSEDFFKHQQPATAAEAIGFLNEIKNYRESSFGKELADKLFGDEQRMYEYKIMLNEIVKDSDMYGSEKEKEIGALKNNLSYESDDKNEMSEMDLYNMKLRLYKKDLLELSESKQKELKEKFRGEIFTPEEASRLDQLELHNEQEALREKGIPENN